MKNRYLKIAVWILAVIVVAIIRHITAWADFYALHIYPVVSGVLSYVAQVVPFSLEEIIALIFVALLVIFIVRRKYISILKLAAVIYIWFYVGWGFNYSRSSILARTGIERASFDKQQFCDFLDRYSSTIDSLFLLYEEPQASDIETGMKEFFSKVPEEYGLARPRSWQHAKKPFLNWLYSGSGVSGFMGPFLCESQVNRDVLPVELPGTITHEYSHLLGVSSEAEANWWAFQACNAQPSASLRFCAHYSILQFVAANAQNLLQQDEYQAWLASLNPGIIDLFEHSCEHWQKKHFKPLFNVQRFLQNLMLKSNGIPSGTKNYSEVIGLLISIPEV